MKVGINIRNFGAGATPAGLVRWAQLASALGYHLLMISDHVVHTSDVQAQYPAPFYDGFLTLGWLAPQAPMLELGTTVTVLPYRHPLQTARLVTNLDQLSGGRLILGVGVGWAQQEFAALGVPFAQRGALTDEYLAAMTTFWTSEVASFAGQFVTFSDVHTAPRPVQIPYPPIWIGGSSDGALRRAVRFGASWHPINIRVDWLRETGLPRLRAIAETAMRPAPALCPRIKLHLTDTPLANDQRLAGQGTLAQVRDDFAVLAELGAQYVVVDTSANELQSNTREEHDWRMLATLAERVLDLPQQTLR